MAILKTGVGMTDPRLGRIPQFDERSRRFPVRGTTRVENLTPRSYTWNFNPDFVTLDQGAEGACVGFAVGNEIACKPRPFAMDNNRARGIYLQAQQIDEWPGGEYPGADPVYSGTSVLAGVKVAQSMGYYSKYRWAFSQMELAWAVSHVGPAIIGVNWYEGMYTPDHTGLIRPTGELMGGHAILVRGYSVRTARYLLRNSWGYLWGYWGDCYMYATDMERLLNEGGEACIPTRI